MQALRNLIKPTAPACTSPSVLPMSTRAWFVVASLHVDRQGRLASPRHLKQNLSAACLRGQPDRSNIHASIDRSRTVRDSGPRAARPVGRGAGSIDRLGVRPATCTRCTGSTLNVRSMVCTRSGIGALCIDEVIDMQRGGLRRQPCRPLHVKR